MDLLNFFPGHDRERLDFSQAKELQGKTLSFFDEKGESLFHKPKIISVEVHEGAACSFVKIKISAPLFHGWSDVVEVYSMTSLLKGVVVNDQSFMGRIEILEE